MESGDYCSQCGQKLRIHVDPTFHDLVHDTIHEFLHLDGKIFSTIKMLFINPGHLTKEFLSGRRVAYINPIRLYLTMSILYFVVSSLSFSESSDKVIKDLESDADVEKEFIKATKKEEKKDAKGHLGLSKLEPLKMPGSDPESELVLDIKTGTFLDPKIEQWKPHFFKGIKKINKDSTEFKKIYSASLAKSLFLLMPLFALILSVLYIRHKRRYPQYLYFSLHYHAALFAGLIITIPLSYISDASVLWWMLWAWLYLFLSFKRIWNDSTKRAFQRTCILLFVYGSIFGITLGAIAVYSIYKLGVQA
jgi:hypothetical protein